MKSLSPLKKPLYSAFTFFGTLIVLTVGYATLSTGLTISDRVNTGSGLTSSSWNRIVNGVLELDTRTAPISSNGGNVGIGIVSPTSILHIVTDSSAGGNPTLRIWDKSNATTIMVQKI